MYDLPGALKLNLSDGVTFRLPQFLLFLAHRCTSRMPSSQRKHKRVNSRRARQTVASLRKRYQRRVSSMKRNRAMVRSRGGSSRLSVDKLRNLGTSRLTVEQLHKVGKESEAEVALKRQQQSLNPLNRKSLNPRTTAPTPCLTDSYKMSHSAQYPCVYTSHLTQEKQAADKHDNKYGAYCTSYFEARGSKMETGEDDVTHVKHVAFFGLQYFLKQYLQGDVFNNNDLSTFQLFANKHLGPDVAAINIKDFKALKLGHNVNGGDYGPGGPDGLTVQPGHLPIKIESVPEGEIVPVKNMLFKVTNTHPRFFWLPNYLETLLVQVWYPMTVCTSAVYQNKVLTEGFKRDVDPYGLLDFGFRGSTSVESAGIGSLAYLAAGFKGTDTAVGLHVAEHYYDSDNTSGAIGTSVPASEHSTITSWCKNDDTSRENFESDELSAWINQLERYKNSFAVAFVSDGYNIWNAMYNQWPSKQMMKHLDEFFSTPPPEGLPKILVLRPDSGDGSEQLPQLAEVLYKGFMNEKGYLERKYPKLFKLVQCAEPGDRKNDRQFFSPDAYGSYPVCIKILQGDAVSYKSLPKYLYAIRDRSSWSVNQFFFGSGGGLLQKYDRDTFKCAFKCCNMEFLNDAKGEKTTTRLIQKKPIGASSKISKAGDLRVGTLSDGKVVTYQKGTNKYFGEDNTLQNITQGITPLSAVIFENGVLAKDKSYTIEKIRETVQKTAGRMKIPACPAKTVQTFLDDERYIQDRINQANLGSMWWEHPKIKSDSRDRDAQTVLKEDFLGSNKTL